MRLAFALAAVVAAFAAAGCSGEQGEQSRPAAGESSAETASPAPGLSPVRFYREHVTVSVSRGLVRVSALYYFRNESGRAVRQGIRYPFPIDRFHGYPETVAVWDASGDTLDPVEFTPGDAWVHWDMTLDGGAEKIVRVDYAQPLAEKRATYIVTTTREWKRPIEVAEFEFRVPASFDSVRLSFEPDGQRVLGDTNVYYMRSESFMPDTNLTIAWE